MRIRKMNDPVLEYYNYGELKHRQIRLIKIHPADQLNSFDQLEVDLVVESLDKARYDALSYTW
jgi:hypothetical protein